MRRESHESDLKIGSVVIDCINFEEMLAFWQPATHYVTRESAKDGWVILRDPAGRNTNVSLNQVSLLRSSKAETGYTSTSIQRTRRMKLNGCSS